MDQRKEKGVLEGRDESYIVGPGRPYRGSDIGVGMEW